MRQLAVLLLLPLLAACSVGMAASRSTYKGNPAIMQPGADRSMIENTFGPADLTTPLGNGYTKAIYKIDPNAQREITRDAAVAGHAVADVATLGLWEAIGTPIEVAAQDKMTNYILIYGPDNRVQSVETVK